MPIYVVILFEWTAEAYYLFSFAIWPPSFLQDGNRSHLKYYRHYMMLNSLTHCMVSSMCYILTMTHSQTELSPTLNVVSVLTFLLGRLQSIFHVLWIRARKWLSPHGKCATLGLEGTSRRPQEIKVDCGHWLRHWSMQLTIPSAHKPLAW